MKTHCIKVTDKNGSWNFDAYHWRVARDGSLIIYERLNTYGSHQEEAVPTRAFAKGCWNTVAEQRV